MAKMHVVADAAPPPCNTRRRPYGRAQKLSFLKILWRGYFGVDVSAWSFRREAFGADLSAGSFPCGAFGAELSARTLRIIVNSDVKLSTLEF